MGITSKMLTERGRRQARELGIDPDRLPRGQVIARKFPILTVGPTPPFDLQTWSLSIWGAVDEPFTLRWEDLMDLPQVEVVTDIHCVTRWSKLDTRWTGVRPRDVLSRAGVQPAASHVMAHCDGGYTTNLELGALDDDDVLLAHSYDGAPLEAGHGAPLRLVVPQRYFWKSAKFVRQIEVMAGHRSGFWEDSGYHDHGDPWAEERHR